MKLWHYQGLTQKLAIVFQIFLNTSQMSLCLLINKYVVCPSSDEKVMAQR